MILSCHLLTGAAIASKIHSHPLAFFLALVSHFVLDFIPHWDYSSGKNKRTTLLPILNKNGERIPLLTPLKGALDLSLGMLLVLLFSGGRPIIIIGALVAILPDAISLFNMLFPKKILKNYDNFHLEKVHFLKNKKIPLFWKIFSEVLVILVAIYFLLQP